MSGIQPKIIPPCEEGFLEINDVPTHLVTYGCWIEDDPTIKDFKLIAIVLPGNPGITEFYKEFMETIYENLKRKVAVWGISHAGHVKVPPDVTIPPINGNEELYGLQGQINHKIAFIEQYVPEDASVVLIGHSIGCHIALEVMRSAVGSQIIRAILLFPTIENLALSPQGQIATPLLKYFRPIASVLLFFISYLSTRIQYKLIEWYFQGKEVPECALRASMNIFDPRCAKRWMFMAHEEMAQVKDADVANIEQQIDRLVFYYGATDHWCPMSYYQSMKARFPSANILLCKEGYDHAFVLESSEGVGNFVVKWIQDIFSERQLE